MLLNGSVKLIEPKARFGAVEHGTLTVQGKLRKALYYGVFDGNREEAWLERHPDDHLDCTLAITKVFPDAIEREFLSFEQANTDPIHVYLLEVGRCVGSGKRGPAGLVLRETLRSTETELQTFKRLGMFHIDEKRIKLQRGTPMPEEWITKAQSELSWFNECALSVISII